ncbi:CGNR zinc finger domain-containing protein [Kribbella sp. NPDC006257]|uniref:CGNR zinc finger domain-containing protein n=1 Tax=Kribbella sp. NPDC006257 TaxID=3156738 RepID=UPI0033B9DF6C
MSYQPELIGGHLLVDLVNTVSWRLDGARRIDRLSTRVDLADWCAAVGLSPGDTPLQDVTRLREIAYRVLRPMARGEGPARADLDALRRLIVEAMDTAEPSAPDLVRLLDWQVDGLMGTLAMAAARLLERADLTRLRECQDDDCGWLFLDRSKNGSRRWCSSADCGNRARAKRHYERVRSS